MTASSQKPPGALPPNLTPVPPQTPDAVRAAYAAYGVAIPAPAGTRYYDPWQNSDVPHALRSPFPEPACEGPACTVCGVLAGSADTALYPDPKGRRYPSGAQVLYCAGHRPAADEPPAVTTVQAAAAVMDAKIEEQGSATGAELAEAEAMAGVFFDAAHVEAVRSATLEQARTEYAAEIAETRRQLAAIAGSRRQVEAVRRLCEGRRGDDMLLVSAVAVAAEWGTTALDDLPMTLTWKRSAQVPDAHDAHKRVLVECTSSYGGRADLVVDGDDRMALASLLDAEVIRDINAPCPHEAGCGSDDAHLDSAGVFGWFRLETGGLDGGPRWYCSPGCVNAAMTRAGDDLALADQAALYPEAVIPDTQATDIAADLDERYGPGASDEYALQVAEAIDEAFDDERGDVDEDEDGAW